MKLRPEIPQKGKQQEGLSMGLARDGTGGIRAGPVYLKGYQTRTNLLVGPKDGFPYPDLFYPGVQTYLLRPVCHQISLITN